MFGMPNILGGGETECGDRHANHGIFEKPSGGKSRAHRFDPPTPKHGNREILIYAKRGGNALGIIQTVDRGSFYSRHSLPSRLPGNPAHDNARTQTARWPCLGPQPPGTFGFFRRIRTGLPLTYRRRIPLLPWCIYFAEKNHRGNLRPVFHMVFYQAYLHDFGMVYSHARQIPFSLLSCASILQSATYLTD